MDSVVRDVILTRLVDEMSRDTERERERAKRRCIDGKRDSDWCANELVVPCLGRNARTHTHTIH